MLVFITKLKILNYNCKQLNKYCYVFLFQLQIYTAISYKTNALLKKFENLFVFKAK